MYSSSCTMYNHCENFSNILFCLFSNNNSINNMLWMFVVLICFYFMSHCSIMWKHVHERFQAWFPLVICVTHNCSTCNNVKSCRWKKLLIYWLVTCQSVMCISSCVALSTEVSSIPLYCSDWALSVLERSLGFGVISMCWWLHCGNASNVTKLLTLKLATL